MNIISIGSDRNLFQDGSGVQTRALFYSVAADETHIIVFALKQLGLQERRLSDKVFLYPTNSSSRFAYVFDAYSIAKRILTTHYSLLTTNFLISTQDPFEAGLVGWFIKKKFGLPLQMQIHTDFLNPYFAKESFLNRIRVVIAKFLLPRANCIRVVSERIRRSLLTIHPPKFFRRKIWDGKSYSLPIAVLPAFVDFQKLVAAPIQTDLRKKYPNRFIILMASRLTKEKNIVAAIQAMAEVIKEYSNAFLLIVGEGPERENLKSKILNLKSGEYVKIELWTDNLASYYKTSDIFLVSSWYEGYGRTIIEALACGCPVVSTKVGIADEAIQDGENGFLIASPDAASIAETVRKAIAAQNMLAMREKARLISVNFLLPPDEYLKRLCECYAACQNH